MRFFRRKKMEEVKEKVMPKDIAMKALLFVVGTMLSALAFNLFYVPQGFVGGGLGGVAIILNKIFELDASFVVLIGNTLLIILSLFTLGFKESLMSIVGASVPIHLDTANNIDWPSIFPLFANKLINKIDISRFCKNAEYFIAITNPNSYINTI